MEKGGGEVVEKVILNGSSIPFICDSSFTLKTFPSLQNESLFSETCLGKYPFPFQSNGFADDRLEVTCPVFFQVSKRHVSKWMETDHFIYRNTRQRFNDQVVFLSLLHAHKTFWHRLRKSENRVFICLLIEVPQV